jgi:muramoyltetrapeptide carboxypeptidase
MSKKDSQMLFHRVVEVLAPASGIVHSDLKRIQQFLLSQGFDCNIPSTTLGPSYLFANSDKHRFENLKKALQSNNRILWCVRGGYGSARLLEALSKLKKPKQKKVIIGFSDITALHQFFITQWGWSTLHGSMLDELSKKDANPRELKEIFQVVQGKRKELVFNGLRPINDRARKKGSIRGSVVGGNLTILASLAGTPYLKPAKNKFVLLEELSERGYRVDRMLVQLKNAGYFDGAKAIIIGDFLGGAERDGKFVWKHVLKEFAQEIKIPMFSGVPCGHGIYQRPMPFNTSAKIIMGKKNQLIVKNLTWE